MSDIKHPVAKAASAIGTGATVKAAEAAAHVDATVWTLGDMASLAALVYSLCLLTEWFWKRVLKPLAHRRGWIKPKGKPAEFLDSTDNAPLQP